MKNISPKKLFGVFSAVRHGRQFSSKIHWKTLLRSTELLSVMCKLYRAHIGVLQRHLIRFERKLLKLIKCNGIKTVATSIKRIEQSYMLSNKFIYDAPLWISKEWFFPKFRSGQSKIPIEVSRLLLSIHRNMHTKPVISVKSIQSPSGLHLWERVEKLYAKELKAVSEYIRKKTKPIVKSIMGSYHVKISKTVKHAAWNYIGNLSNDPTVDSNDRTGGLEHPLRVTLSKCANGPAISCQMKDAFVLCQDHNKDLKRSLEWIYSMLDYKVDIEKDKTFLTEEEAKESDSFVISKLYALRDKTCKTRTIAIFDSYSQVALRPFHRLWEDFLRVLVSDYTHNHNLGVFNLMRAHTRALRRNPKRYPLSKFYSFDISSATDTIPKELGFWSGYQVLRGLINGQFTEAHCRKTMDAVQTVLVDRDFKTSDGKTVRYTCGQPMGAYGSFPLLALSQHTLVWLACEIVGITNYHSVPYAVVGDDLVIYHDEVANEYKKLCNELNIPINPDKTIVSEDKFKFCARVYVGGKLRNFPSMTSHYVAAKTLSPGPLIDQFYRFKLRTPHYHKWGSIFTYGTIRYHMAFMDLTVYGGPTSWKLYIPRAVLTHADRCLFVQDMLDIYDKKKYKVSETNPYLLRLRYGPQILSIFKSNFKKLDKAGVPNIFNKLLLCRANTFYLSYHMCYKHVGLLHRMKRDQIVFTKLNKDKMEKLFRFCVANRNSWSRVTGG